MNRCNNTECPNFTRFYKHGCNTITRYEVQNCDEFIPFNEIPEFKVEKKENPLDVQEGGNHYKNMPIQPIEFTHKNNLNFCQGNIIKYVTRYKDKNGIEDLKKAKHYIDLLIGFEYSKEKESSNEKK